MTEYQGRSGAVPFVYFRYVDQSNPEIQKQMTDYMKDLATIHAVEERPDRFWLWDLEEFQAKTSPNISNLPFEDILDVFLRQTAYGEMYKDHIVRYENGTIQASRGWICMDNVDWNIVTEQIDALVDQRAVTKRQPINRGRKDWAFFTYINGKSTLSQNRPFECVYGKEIQSLASSSNVLAKPMAFGSSIV